MGVNVYSCEFENVYLTDDADERYAADHPGQTLDEALLEARLEKGDRDTNGAVCLFDSGIDKLSTLSEDLAGLAPYVKSGGVVHVIAEGDLFAYVFQNGKLFTANGYVTYDIASLNEAE